MAVAARNKPKTPAKPVSSRHVVAAARKGGGARRSAHLWENVKSILGAIAIFLVIRFFLVEAYRIPSESMVPTLLVGDFLFVNKLVYGPKIPLTDITLPGYDEPERGEVVIYTSPYQEDQPWDPTPTVVKRLVGVPGDTLLMRDGLLYVNGTPRPQRSESPVHGDGNEPLRPARWHAQALLRTSRFNAQFGPPPEQPTHDNWGPVVVPAGHYFSLGDNRYNSKDARYYGFIPRKNIHGRPTFVYFSFHADSDRPLPFITDIRWRRIGDWIR
jgi:signal peptidase I